MGFFQKFTGGSSIAECFVEIIELPGISTAMWFVRARASAGLV